MTSAKKPKSKLVAVFAGVVFAGVVAVVGVALARWWCHVIVVPEPPVSTTDPIAFPATTSHLSVAVSCPNTAMATHIDSAIPKTFPFDVKNGVRAFGSPSRGAIKIENDVGAKRVVASMPVSGRIQVEKKVVALISVGIDVSGNISASFSPTVAQDWTINPQLGLSAHVDRAVAKTAVGDIDITGRVQDAVNNAVNGVKGTVDAKLASALNVRKDVERIWTEMSSVHKLADDPPTWLRITPQKVDWGQLNYTKDSIESGLALTLEAHVFVQDTAPEVPKVSLPNLNITGRLSDDFELSIPVEVSYAVINKQLQTQLSKDTTKLPEVNASVAITGATLVPYGEGILLTVDFYGKKGLIKSASGRLYIVGVPVFDAANSELRLDELKYTAETQSLLLTSAEWLAHPKLLDTLKAAAIVSLSSELEKAKKKANEQLENLKNKLPKEVGANVSVQEISIDRLAFAKERAFAVVKAKGKLSAQLQK